MEINEKWQWIVNAAYLLAAWLGFPWQALSVLPVWNLFN